MVDSNRGYRAYLVRLWQARSGGQVVWRASAQDAHSDERHAFAELAGLLSFLREATGQSVDVSQSELDKAENCIDAPRSRPFDRPSSLPNNVVKGAEDENHDEK
jgi:hypothetical protein